MRKAVNSIIFMALLSAAPLTAWSYSLDVNINTSGFTGTLATLAFDFIDGDGIINNTVQISNFLPSGSYIPGALSGDASGTLNSTVFLGDNSLVINEFLQSITLGNSLQFHIETSNLFNPGSLTPDSFAFFILDDSASLPLFATTDPLGSDALFTVDLTGANDGLSVFSAQRGSSRALSWTVQSSSVSVPTPGTLLLLAAGITGAYLSRKHRFV